MEFDSEKMLDLYIYDYFVEGNMHITAESFAKEADLHPESFVVPPIEGFLSDWWCLFWDVYCARLNRRRAAQASSSQTTQNAAGMLQSVHPVLPVSSPEVNFAMQMPDFASLLPTVCPTTMMPVSITSTLNMRNLLQNAFPMMLPRTEFNPVNSITDINMLQLQTKTNLIAARMSEKMCLRLPARDICSSLNLSNVNQEVSVLPLSLSSLSLPEESNNKKRKFSVTIDDNVGTGLRGSTSGELILPTPAPRLVQSNTEHADTGSSTSSNSACPDSSS